MIGHSNLQFCQYCNFLYQSGTRFPFFSQFIQHVTSPISSIQLKKAYDKKIVLPRSFKWVAENWNLTLHLEMFDFLLSRTRIMKHSVYGLNNTNFNSYLNSVRGKHWRTQECLILLYTTFFNRERIFFYIYEKVTYVCCLEIQIDELVNMKSERREEREIVPSIEVHSRIWLMTLRSEDTVLVPGLSLKLAVKSIIGTG